MSSAEEQNTTIDTSSVEDIDWNALDKLKRNDLQRLCKEFALPIKATSKNVEIIDALKAFKNEYDIKKKNQEELKAKEKEKEKEKEKQLDIEKKSNVNDKDTDITMNENNSNGDIDVEMKENENNDEDKIFNETEVVVEEFVDERFKDSLPIPEEDELENEQSNNNNVVKRHTINFKKRQDHSDDEDNKKEEAEEEDTTIVDEKVELTHKGLKFRNYIPKDITLTPYRLPKSKVPPVVEELLEKLKILESSAQSQDEDEMISFLPKKANWDLKRDVEKKLSKLDKRTNRAIYELIKQKLEIESGTESNMDLLTRAVNKY